MSEVVYDLTEVFSASTGKLRFYGIMRVVQEIGIELVRQNSTMRYAIFSYAHKGFLEVVPTLDAEGNVHFGVPLGIREFRIRPSFRHKSALSKLLTLLANPVLQRMNRKAWREANTTLPRLDMTGKTLVTGSRPKLIADAMAALEARGEQWDLIPILYDMIPLHPQFGHKSARFPGKFLDDNRLVIEKSRALLAISEFTKSEIQAFSNTGLLPPIPPITAIPLVHECDAGEGTSTLKLPDAPYILTVGATMGRKNLEASFEALLVLHEQGAHVPTLVIAGATRKTTDKYLETDRMVPIRDKVVTYHSPDQVDLTALYRGALALVMASRMEGWGLPPCEALWWGTPAICSTAPVLREGGGDLALYFDPDAPEELAGHIRRLYEDKAFREALQKKIVTAHPDLRTWKRVAQDLQAAIIASA